MVNREENEAYATIKPGEAYVVFFPQEGSVGLNLQEESSVFKLKWMNIREGEWEEETTIDGGCIAELSTPGNNEWVAVIIKE